VLHLYVTLRDRAVGHFELPGDRVRIGRHPDNEVQIDSMAVSRHHCQLARGDHGGWTVEDLGSNNGTFVNGSRIAERSPVRDGDVLSIGKFQVSFRDAGADGAALPAAAPVRADGPEMREHAAPLKGFLILQNRRGAPVPLERDAFVIGDAPGADLPAGGGPRLAVIVRGFGGFQVLDVGPTPGAVRVHGRPVERAWLGDGDLLAVGDLELEFHLGLPTDDQSTMSIQVPLGGFRPPER
jgi:pSer/pThr/pTyr-binding forkhead associated (FHA) protein